MKLTLEDLTVEEKLRLLCGKDFWHIGDLNGKLPSILTSDGPVGVRHTVPVEGSADKTVPSVAYPSVQVLANTWSTECARLTGEALADDCLDQDIHLLLAPGVNIKRSPLCGRNFEYFSEDPLLAGTLAREYIVGLQSRGVGACVKHYLANNLEYDRFHQSSEIDERTMREIYYKPFEIACEAKPVSAMCSYNRVNGEYASENKKGFKVLREEFGFDGIVVSDWGAVRDRTAAAKAGLDVEMPFNEQNYEKLAEDYRAGKISEEEVDACARRVLDFIYRMNDMHAKAKAKTSVEERSARARKVAAEGIVLLKNDGVLPLSGKENLSVCGQFAKPEDWSLLVGDGSSRVQPISEKFDLPAELQKRTKGKVLYEGAFGWRDILSFRQDARVAILNAAQSDVNIVCAGTGSHEESEEMDKRGMRLSSAQERAILDTAEANPNTVVILFAGAAVDVSPWEEEVAAIVYAGFPGMGADEVIADILTGKINPSGKTSETFARLDDYPASHTFINGGVTRYEEGLDVGYRYFCTYDEPTLYPFGFGLSYSEFEYGNLKLEVKDGALEVGFGISNVSERDGKEVSQIYVRECAPLVYRPARELKAFSKDEVKAGKQKSVKLTLEKSAFVHWSTATDEWKVEDGVYEILVCASAEDVKLIGKIKIGEGKISVL